MAIFPLFWGDMMTCALHLYAQCIVLCCIVLSCVVLCCVVLWTCSSQSDPHSSSLRHVLLRWNTLNSKNAMYFHPISDYESCCLLLSRMTAPAVTGFLMQTLGHVAPLLCCTLAASIATIFSHVSGNRLPKVAEVWCPIQGSLTLIVLTVPDLHWARNLCGATGMN